MNAYRTSPLRPPPLRLLAIRCEWAGVGVWSGASDDGLFAIDIIEHGEGIYSATLREARAWAHPGDDAPLAYVSRVAFADLAPALLRQLSRGIEVRRAAERAVQEGSKRA